MEIVQYISETAWFADENRPCLFENLLDRFIRCRYQINTILVVILEIHRRTAILFDC